MYISYWFFTFKQLIVIRLHWRGNSLLKNLWITLEIKKTFNFGTVILGVCLLFWCVPHGPPTKVLGMQPRTQHTPFYVTRSWHIKNKHDVLYHDLLFVYLVHPEERAIHFLRPIRFFNILHVPYYFSSKKCESKT